MENDFLSFRIPSWEEIPDIGLYLNQTVTILEDYLKPFICNKDEKVITNTMVNNYVKMGLLEAPVNKRYKREHVACLFVLCILKQVYSINDVKKLFGLSFKNNKTTKTAYKYFCSALEKSILAVFNHKDLPDLHSKSNSKYILKNVVTSYATKLYVSQNFLKGAPDVNTPIL